MGLQAGPPPADLHLMRRSLLSLLALSAAAGALPPAASADRADLQFTAAITDGNGDSTHPVISQDRRYSTVLAFESEATDLVGGDVNGHKDVFMIRRTGRPNNQGTEWNPGPAQLVSRGLGGAPADGPSWGAAIDGGFPEPGNRPTYPKCIAFLSDATNLVPGDTNGVTDAFVSRGPGGAIERVSLPGGRQSSVPASSVVVSTDCSHVAYVAGGRLHVRYRRAVKRFRLRRMSARARKAARRPRHKSFSLPGAAADPSFATGQTDDLVAGADGGAYLMRNGTGRPRLVAPGASNPSYNDVKCRVVAYEKPAGGATQVMWRYLGRAPSRFRRAGAGVGCDALDKPGEQLASKAPDGGAADGDSTDPYVVNSGHYISFESHAAGLGVNALGRIGDFNGRPDAYLYTAVRDLTLVQSVEEKAEPLRGGGTNPSMSWYANYMFFDSPIGGHAGLPLGLLGPAAGERPVRQILLRYLGPV
jgi:hypothetical protein